MRVSERPYAFTKESLRLPDNGADIAKIEERRWHTNVVLQGFTITASPGQRIARRSSDQM